MQAPEWLTRWGFKASTPLSPVQQEPVDCVRDVAQVKELLASGVTPAMLLKHPYIKLTADARKYLEGLATGEEFAGNTSQSDQEIEWLELETKHADRTITPDEFRWLGYLRGAVDQNKVNALLHPSIPQKKK